MSDGDNWSEAPHAGARRRVGSAYTVEIPPIYISHHGPHARGPSVDRTIKEDEEPSTPSKPSGADAYLMRSDGFRNKFRRFSEPIRLWARRLVVWAQLAVRSQTGTAPGGSALAITPTACRSQQSKRRILLSAFPCPSFVAGRPFWFIIACLCLYLSLVAPFNFDAVSVALTTKFAHPQLSVDLAGGGGLPPRWHYEFLNCPEPVAVTVLVSLTNLAH